MMKSVKRRFNDLDWQRQALIKAINAMPIPDKEPIFRALAFAEEKHEGQFRQNRIRSKYIIHPIRVARILIEEAGVRDADVLIAGLLHDTIEDCNVSRSEIGRLFGGRVAAVVASVSKNSFGSEEEYWLHFKDASLDDKLVKASDRLDKLRSITDEGATEIWPEGRIEACIVQTERYMLPMAKDANAVLAERLEQLVSSIRVGVLAG
jgi:(p)ppGpp synthase/HD superfamily hydrolase